MNILIKLIFLGVFLIVISFTAKLTNAAMQCTGCMPDDRSCTGEGYEMCCDENGCDTPCCGGGGGQGPQAPVVAGYLKDYLGRPIANTEIRWTDYLGNIRKRWTNASGYYSFASWINLAGMNDQQQSDFREAEYGSYPGSPWISNTYQYEAYSSSQNPHTFTGVALGAQLFGAMIPRSGINLVEAPDPLPIDLVYKPPPIGYPTGPTSGTVGVPAGPFYSYAEGWGMTLTRIYVASTTTSNANLALGSAWTLIGQTACNSANNSCTSENYYWTPPAVGSYYITTNAFTSNPPNTWCSGNPIIDWGLYTQAASCTGVFGGVTHSSWYVFTVSPPATPTPTPIIPPATPIPVTLSGYVMDNLGNGIGGVVINQGVTDPLGCGIGTATSSNSQETKGYWQIPNVTTGTAFCLRAPGISGYTGPNRSYECQSAGMKFGPPDLCGAGGGNGDRDLIADNQYNFIYTIIPTPTSGPTPPPAIIVTPTPTIITPTPTPGAGTPTPTPIVPSPTPITPTFCILGTYTGSGIIISWTNPVGYPVTFADISSDSNFTNYYNKPVLGTSTTAPDGFCLAPYSGTCDNSKNPLVIMPDITYYVRLYNGVPTNGGHGPTRSFGPIPNCPNKPFLKTVGGDVHINR